MQEVRQRTGQRQSHFQRTASTAQRRENQQSVNTTINHEGRIRAFDISIVFLLDPKTNPAVFRLQRSRVAWSLFLHEEMRPLGS